MKIGHVLSRYAIGQIDRQIDRQTDKQTNINVCLLSVI